MLEEKGRKKRKKIEEKPNEEVNVSCCPGPMVDQTKQTAQNKKPPRQEYSGHEHPG